MGQTPVHDNHNPDLLRLIPQGAASLIEVGCSSGALAREFKKINPACNYLGIDIDESYVKLAARYCDDTAHLAAGCHIRRGYVKLAARYCDDTLAMDIEHADEWFFESNGMRDCWIFGDALEHLQNPWGILEKIRKVIPKHGSIVACIPNAQHWSLIAKLSIGDFRYEDNGLLDRTHLRWFTRQTIIELFNDAGFNIVEGVARVFDEPAKDRFLPFIAELAKASGMDPGLAIADAIPLQHVVGQNLDRTHAK